jgi:hypothetical protein
VVWHAFVCGHDSRLVVRCDYDEWTGVHGVNSSGQESRYGGFLAWEAQWRLGQVFILDLDLMRHIASILERRLLRTGACMAAMLITASSCFNDTNSIYQPLNLYLLPVIYGVKFPCVTGSFLLQNIIDRHPSPKSHSSISSLQFPPHLSRRDLGSPRLPWLV